MKLADLVSTLRESLEERVGSTCMVPAGAVEEVLRRMGNRASAKIPRGSFAKVREYLAANPGVTTDKATADLGFPSYHPLRRMMDGGYVRREEIAPGVFGYWLTDKPLFVRAKMRTDAERKAANTESKRRFRERVLAERIAGGYVPRKKLTPEERHEAKLERNRAYRARLRAAAEARNPKRQRSPAISEAARLVKDTAITVALAQKGAPKVELAVKEELPDTETFLRANPDKFERLPGIGEVLVIRKEEGVVAKKNRSRQASKLWNTGVSTARRA